MKDAVDENKTIPDPAYLGNPNDAPKILNPIDFDAWIVAAGDTRVIDIITLSALGTGGQEYYFEMAN